MAELRDPQRLPPRGTPNDPYVIDDEEEGLEDSINHGSRVAAMISQLQDMRDWWRPSISGRARSDGNSPDQSELFNELELEERVAEDLANFIDLTEDDDPPRVPVPKLGVPCEQRELESYNHIQGMVFRQGVTVELKYPEPGGMAFLRVLSVVQSFSPDGRNEIKLQGWPYLRARSLRGELPCKLNEVVLLSRMDSGSKAPWEHQSVIEISINEVKTIRELRMTNAPFPEHRFDPEVYENLGKCWMECNGPLVCRYRREAWYTARSDRPREWALVRLTEEEADSRYRWEDRTLLNRWRGGKVPGGSHPSGLVFDLEKDVANDQPHLQPGQRYTAGDIFAGAGGASRGIERAGLHLLYSLDHWEPAASSLRLNFPKTDVYECDVTDFIKDPTIRYTTDILHLSPPCQFWSPAHTVAGKNDEANIDVLFSCEHLIKKLRPRLFTVEQTFGIVHSRFSEYFATLIHGFTCSGYSVRWKVVVLANYGVPQSRKRLIMIGSAPGEKLPPFPPPTHSKDGSNNLPRWVTPKDALEKVKHITAEDNKHHSRKRFESPKPRWDPSQMAKTITCGGGQNYHWNGKRDFTKLEYAVLQGFPTWHKFKDVAVKKQIGNAFAPNVVRVFYRHLVRWLLEQDGFETGASAPLPAEGTPVRPIRIRDNEGQRDVVMIDSSDEEGKYGGGGNGGGSGSEDEVIWTGENVVRRREKEEVDWMEIVDDEDDSGSVSSMTMDEDSDNDRSF